MGKISESYKRKSKKLFAAMICLDLLILLTVGASLAYIFTTSGEVKNTFTPPKPDTKVEEEFKDQLIKENVSIAVENTDNAGVKSYVRAMVVVSWQTQTADQSGTNSVLPADENDYSIEYNLNNQADTEGQWFLGADGFYYFTEPVDPGSKTTALIKKAVQEAEAPEGYYLHVEILGQGIQAEPIEAATSSWGVTINEATITGPMADPQPN